MRFQWLVSLFKHTKFSSFFFPSLPAPLPVLLPKEEQGTQLSLKEQWAIASKDLKILVTPEANDYIHSDISAPKVLEMIGTVMSFKKARQYRAGKSVARLSPNTRPVTHIINGPLGFCHWVAEEKVLLFVPLPWERRGEMHPAFFDKEFARSFELNIT